MYTIYWYFSVKVQFASNNFKYVLSNILKQRTFSLFFIFPDPQTSLVNKPKVVGNWVCVEE